MNANDHYAHKKAHDRFELGLYVAVSVFAMGFCLVIICLIEMEAERARSSNYKAVPEVSQRHP